MIIIHPFEAPLNCLKAVDALATISALGFMIVGMLGRKRARLPSLMSNLSKDAAWAVTLVNIAVMLWLFSALFSDIATTYRQPAYETAYLQCWLATFFEHLTFVPVYILIVGVIRHILDKLGAKTKGSQQAGPAYPPQGVGSADP